MRHLIAALALLTLTAFSHSAQADAWYGGPFSAEIFMSSPDNPANQASGRLYVGENRLRAEGTNQGETMAVILDAPNRKAWTLLLNQQQFYEGLGNAPMPPQPDVEALPSDPDSPCQTGSQQFRCRQLGVEAINGVNTEKWEVSRANQQGQMMTLTMWVDPQRRAILRRQSPNGVVMERRFMGMETVNGRQTEKWLFSQSFGNQSRQYTQWIDARLRVPVRVTGQQEYVSELRNIQEGPQPDALFQIPAGFQQVAAPQQEQGQSQR